MAEGVVPATTSLAQTLRRIQDRYRLRIENAVHVGANLGQEAGDYEALGIRKVQWIEADPAVFQRLEANVARFAGQSAILACVSDKDGEIVPFYISRDELLLIDSTPVPCAASRETVRRSALGELADYGYCASHSRYFWGLRLHALCAPDGTPRALELASPKRDEHEVGLELLARCRRSGGELLIGDNKGYAGRKFAAGVAALDATVVRPARKDEPGRGPHLAPIRQRIESIFWTCKDLLTLERHGARTMAGLRERVLSHFLCLAACSSLNHRLGRPAAL